MLVLTFCIGQSRFAIDARRVIQVVPRIPLLALPLSEPYIAGLLDFRGSVVVVVDLATRLFGTACATQLSTRIIIVRLIHREQEVLLGLVAEQVTELFESDGPQAAQLPTTSLDFDLLGGMLRVGDAVAQWLDIDRVLPGSLCARPFEQIPE